MSKQLTQEIEYEFHNTTLLKEALTHPSISYMKVHQHSYERLEFLGDTVLSMIIAEILYTNFPSETEGDLSKRHIALVKGQTLAEVAKTIKLGNYIIISEGERSNGGTQNMKILENVMEALIGAIYIDGGCDSIKKIITKYWMPLLLETKFPPENVKSTLQEWAQQRGLAPPTYQIIDSSGLAHCPTMTIKLELKGFEPIIVQSKNKRDGEQKAAKLMINSISNIS